jgi:predicted Zn-dependent peptidase
LPHALCQVGEHMGWGTAIGEALRLVTDFLLDPKRKAKRLEEEKQQALREARETAYGDDAKKLEDRINQLPK